MKLNLAPPPPSDLRPVLKKHARLPEWVAKCAWRSTGYNIVVSARNEDEAVAKAWRKVSRTIGGFMCIDVTVRRK